MRTIKVEDKILSLNHYDTDSDIGEVGGVCLLYFSCFLQNQGDIAGSFLYIRFEVSVSNSDG